MFPQARLIHEAMNERFVLPPADPSTVRYTLGWWNAEYGEYQPWTEAANSKALFLHIPQASTLVRVAKLKLPEHACQGKHDQTGPKLSVSIVRKKLW